LEIIEFQNFEKMDIKIEKWFGEWNVTNFDILVVIRTGKLFGRRKTSDFSCEVLRPSCIPKMT
jgi:hypothetical protein